MPKPPQPPDTNDQLDQLLKQTDEIEPMLRKIIDQGKVTNNLLSQILEAVTVKPP